MLNAWLAFRALPWRTIGLAALAFAVLSLFAHDRMVVAQNAKLKAQLTACSEGRKADRTSYERAQSEAQAQNRAEVARIEKQQQDINNEVTRDLNARLERLRSELRQRASAPQGHPGSPGAPQGPDRPATPGEAGVCLAPEELLRAAENEERHDQLITAVTRLMALLNK